jgi:hypothetical protein
VTEVIMITFGFFLFSISEYSFFITAIKKLFYARTMDEELFGPKSGSGHATKYLDKSIIP